MEIYRIEIRLIEKGGDTVDNKSFKYFGPWLKLETADEKYEEAVDRLKAFLPEDLESDELAL